MQINKGTSTLCKLFDLELKRKDRGASQLFVGIDKQEFQLLVNYFETRKVKVEIVDEQNDKFDDNTDEEIDDPNVKDYLIFKILIIKNNLGSKKKKIKSY